MGRIIDILDSITYEEGLKIDDVESSLKEALIKTAQRMIDTTLIFDANIDGANKKLELFQKIEVVSKDDDRLKEGPLTKEGTSINPENYISLEEAKEINPDLDIGDFMSYELEFENMGRDAATILLSDLEFRLQKFVEENIVGKYKEKVGKTASGTVTRIDKSDNTYIEIGEIKGTLQRESRMKGELFKVGDAVKAVVKSVNIDKANGLLVEISRTNPKFLENLSVLEIPELKDKKIAVEASVRIPGTRSKIALSTIDAQIDPIDAVAGVKGVRIGSASEQLNGENIDCVEYSEIPEIFTSRALSPAIIHSVKIGKNPENEERRKAVVTISSDQKSKAIGKAGLNIRLTSMSTKYDIELIEIGSKTPTLNSKTSVQVNEKTTDTASLETLFK